MALNDSHESRSPAFYGGLTSDASDVSQRSSRDYTGHMRDLVMQATADIDCTVVLFGSRARDTHRKNSDIDVGFCGLNEAQFVKVRDTVLAELEESIIPHHVDLVNLDAVPEKFRDIALERVIVWKQRSRVN